MGHQELERVLEYVRDMHHKSAARMADWHHEHGNPNFVMDTTLIDDLLDEARPYLPLFLEDHSTKTHDELSEMADKVSPGWTHDSGAVACTVYESMCSFVDPLLLAAAIYRNWGGGKVGFQFLPLPHECDPDDYSYSAWDLVEFLQNATDGDPLRVLIGSDRDFYNSLPDRIRIYRGAAGISPYLTAQGVCWSIDRNYAEWFAKRSSHYGEPVLVAAWVKKEDIALAIADEGEIVCQPYRWAQLKCRPQEKRPPAPFIVDLEVEAA